MGQEDPREPIRLKGSGKAGIMRHRRFGDAPPDTLTGVDKERGLIHHGVGSGLPDPSITANVDVCSGAIQRGGPGSMVASGAR